MRLTVLLIGSTLLALDVAVFAWQTSKADLSNLSPTPSSVSLRFQNAPLAEVISFLAIASGIQLRIAPDVTLPKDPVNLNFSNADFKEVFTLLMTLGNLS